MDEMLLDVQSDDRSERKVDRGHNRLWIKMMQEIWDMCKI